ncbi:MAG TPA: hypothetical protein VMS63_03575 [Gaiellaceae bacterium]|nr:hypothetical protein [Gaiellaceae bacterium]
MKVGKPRWTTASFLLYAGGLTVLGAALAALGYLSGHYGKAAYAGWAALILVVLYALAHAYRRRDRWIASGIFGFASVIAWAAFVGALWSWFGWLSGASASSFAHFSVARLSLELLVLAAAIDDTRRFRFPFIASIAVFVGWFFVLDLLSAGGNWSAVVTLLVGLAYLMAGAASSRPTAFWLHLAAGTLIGGSLLYWWHTSDADWALVSVAALVYVGIAYASHRSSWAVLATLGLIAAGAHYAGEWSHGSINVSTSTVPSIRGWVPSLVFAFVGFLLVTLGLRGRHGRDDSAV